MGRQGFLGSLFILMVVWSQASHALEYVSPDQAQQLLQEFASAKPVQLQHVESWSGQSIACDMYGMRTRLQVEKEVKLYNFVKGAQGWKNQGAHVVDHYEVDKSGFKGTRASIRDELRLAANGTFIAELSKGTANEKVVLAYSRCRTH